MADSMMKLGLFLEGTGHHVAAWRDPEVDPHGRQSLAHFVHWRGSPSAASSTAVPGRHQRHLRRRRRQVGWTRTTRASRLERSPAGALAAVTAADRAWSPTATTSLFRAVPGGALVWLDRQDHGGRAGWRICYLACGGGGLRLRPGKRIQSSRRSLWRARELPKWCSDCGIAWRTTRCRRQGTAASISTATNFIFSSKGKHFSVRGPLIVHRSPQGHPVIVQAGNPTTDATLPRKPRNHFTVQQDLEVGRAFYADITRRAAAYGRPPHAIKVLPGVMTVIGRTRAEAAEQIRAASGAAVAGTRHEGFASYFGFDLATYPLDGPVPDPSPESSRKAASP